jgi:hypothetical protein
MLGEFLAKLPTNCAGRVSAASTTSVRRSGTPLATMVISHLGSLPRTFLACGMVSRPLWHPVKPTAGSAATSSTMLSQYSTVVACMIWTT